MPPGVTPSPTRLRTRARTLPNNAEGLAELHDNARRAAGSTSSPAIAVTEQQQQRDQRRRGTGTTAVGPGPAPGSRGSLVSREEDTARRLTLMRSNSGISPTSGSKAGNANEERRRLTASPGRIGPVAAGGGIGDASPPKEQRRRPTGLAGIAGHFGFGRIRATPTPDEELLDWMNRQPAKVVSIASATDKKWPGGFSEKDLEVLGAKVATNRDQITNWVTSELNVGWACKKGLKPDSPNQDNFSLLYVDGKEALYGVFDGHGPQGHIVSQCARQYLTSFFMLAPDHAQNPEDAFVEAFVETQKRLAAEMKAESALSGTTCSMAYHNMNTDRLTIAHVGDSRCVLGLKRKEANQRHIARIVTIDHKPDVPREKHRIENASPPGRVIFDGFFNHRVYSQNGMYPGLNMSRALGDAIAHSEAGLTAEPDVITVDLKAERRIHSSAVLVLCTDGVWEFVTEERVLDLVTDHCQDRAQHVVDILAEESWSRWMDDSNSQLSDDITALIVHL